jgi:ABC-type polysaccharide/polyol phosphate export permease
MTSTDHNKIIGILHLVYGALSVLMMIVMGAFFVGVFGLAMANEPNAPPPFFIGFMVVFMFIMYVVLAIPSFLAGYALLKRRKTAKVLGIIAAVVAAMSFPLGTGLCVYTLWFLFSEQGREIYEKSAYSLPPAPPVFATATANREYEYVPPRRPPDWR